MSLFGLSSIVPPGIAAVAGQAADRLADGFSFAEQLLRSEDAAGQGAAASGDPTPAEAQSEFQAELDRFRKQLQDRLAAGGVDLSRPITLRSDGFGGVEIDGDHPDRSLIEQIVGRDAELTAAFQRLATRHASIAAGDAGPLTDGEDDSAYQRVLDDIRRRDFRVTFHGQEAQVGA